MPTPLFMDIHPGSNIDDVFALALAAASPEVSLIGVSLHRPDVSRDAAVAARVLDLYGVGAPVLALGRHFDDVAGLLEAAAGLIETHKPATLAVTGPLTNTAALLTRYPRLVASLSRVVFMGGWSSRALPEYNLLCDPEALQTVQQSGVALTAVGYEVTLSCVVRRPHLMRLHASAHPGAQFLHHLYEVWSRETGKALPIMHDPLTVAIICQPDLATTTTIGASIRTRPGPDRGALLTDHSGSPLEICTGVDSRRYLDVLLSRVASTGPQDTVDYANMLFRLSSARSSAHYPEWSLSHLSPHDHVLLLVETGVCSVETLLGSCDVGPGAVVYLPPGQPSMLSAAEHMKATWLQFQAWQVDGHGSLAAVRVLPGIGAFRAMGIDSEVMSLVAERIEKAWFHPWPEGMLLCHAQLQELIAHLLASAREERVALPHPTAQALAAARRYVEAHALERLTLEALAGKVGLSRFYLARMFRYVYGVAPIQYQLELRMERAKQLLEYGDKSLEGIARDVGYSSLSAFSRAFQRHTGAPPSRYRATREGNTSGK